jgi:hypothetical protein
MDELNKLTKYLPEGWEGAARETGALERGRKIKTAEDLLELILLHNTEGGSFGTTAALITFATEMEISKQSVYDRIQKSWRWLKWMIEGMCLEQGISMPKPEWLNREVVTIDGSEMSLRGSKQGDWRLHLGFDIFGFQYRTIEITDVKQGEKLSRHAIRKGDIVLADRMYGTIQGMAHVRGSEADFILRYRTKAFNVYDENGTKLELIDCFKGMKPMESTSVYGCYYHEGKRHRVRIVAMRKDDEAVEKTKQRMKKKIRKQRGKQPSAEALLFNEYIVVATSLDDTYTDNQILELYRARWQVEQVFLRLKSLFDFGDVPSKNDDTVKAWFYGKLFLAVLCETILKTECFSPEEEKY